MSNIIIPRSVLLESLDGIIYSNKMPPSKKIKYDDEITIIDEKPGTSKENNTDWRESARGFKERHKHALKQGILTDVSFAVGPQGTLLSAHRMILALASPVFEVMFYGSLKETSEVISIPDLTPIGFHLLLDYIYTDEMEFKSETDALYAWFAADKYCLSHMRELCCNYLSECELTNNNVWIILENSVFLNSPTLADRCLLYLKNYIDEAMVAPSFLEISGETMKRILTLDSLYIKEIRLLEGVVLWAEEKVKNGDQQSLQQFLEPFLCHIRFSCMSQTEFVDFIDMHKNIISDTDALAILKHMTDNRSYSLPAWCSHNVAPRRECEKRVRGLKKMTLSIRSYAIKPQSTPRLSELGSMSNGRNEPYNVARFHWNSSQGYSPSRRPNEGGDSPLYSPSDDDDDDNDYARRAVAAANIDSDDSSSSCSDSSSSSRESLTN